MDSSATKLTKREVASRQLNQAIRLFFERADMLAVHTLTAAAFQILEDLGRVGGIVSRLRSQEFVRADRMKGWVQTLRSTQNFLKHAEEDGEASLDYGEEGTILFLYETVELADRMPLEDIAERLAFRVWFVFSFPDLFQPEFVNEQRTKVPAEVNPTDHDLWARWLKDPKSRLR